MWTAFIVGVAVLIVTLALATGAWIIVVPLALLLAGVGVGTYFLGHKGQTGRMRHLREQAHGAVRATEAAWTSPTGTARH